MQYAKQYIFFFTNKQETCSPKTEDFFLVLGKKKRHFMTIAKRGN